MYNAQIPFRYEIPDIWYNGLYKDKKTCCSAARPFSLLHGKPSKECWLLVHGYRGYPGELVHPASDEKLKRLTAEFLKNEI